MENKKKTIEEKYKKLSDKSHVLRRPGMYIGSIVRSKSNKYILDDYSNMINSEVDYIPGRLKT